MATRAMGALGARAQVRAASDSRASSRRLVRGVMATARATDEEKNENAYEILGVETSCSSEDVKRAYKRLALKNHPDKLRNVSDAARAEAQERFRAVSTAYEVLRDALKRAEYDAKLELNGAKKDDVLVNVSFKESVMGGTKLAMVPFKLVCVECRGVGMACPRCETCKGTPTTSAGAACEACEGKGFGKPETCAKCGGDGVKDDFFHGRVHVPPGVENGARLPISGRSQHVRVRILPSKVFTRDGLNVTSTLRLSAADAKEGGFFDVETVHGVETTYFDEETTHGDTKTLTGKGIKDGKKTGDHIVRVEVEREPTPPPNDEEEEREENDQDAPVDDEPPSKRAKDDHTPESDAQTELERLLAEKKAKLLAQLDAAAKSA
jgi:molecular chaperone DnaJ